MENKRYNLSLVQKDNVLYQELGKYYIEINLDNMSWLVRNRNSGRVYKSNYPYKNVRWAKASLRRKLIAMKIIQKKVRIYL